jgi:molybdopterin-guanine dinucleotide biosynthesis protein
MADADLVLCEGFKATDLPKVEIFRRAAQDAPLFDPALPNAAAWQAMVCDGEMPGVPFPVFRLDHDGWLDELVAWVERQYLPNRA